jgi:DNA-binding beta-propeller fold protein YncE
MPIMFTMKAAVAAAAVAVVAATAVTASAATEPVSNPRILVRYDLAAGQQPENVALEPDGNLDVTLSIAGQVERVTPTGQRQLLATLPAPSDGGVNTPVLGHSLATGLVRTADGTLYIGYAAGHDDLTGIWRVRPGGTPTRIAPLTAASFPNGMALDERTGTLYIADSTRETIWRVPITGGTPTAWLSGPELKRSTGLGPNGLRIHNAAVWLSNSDQGTLLRVPIEGNGRAGAVETKATGLPFFPDDFAFIGHTDKIIVALNVANEVALVQPNGSYTIVLTGTDGLEGPTAVAIRQGKLYVLSAAFILKDPNILVADLATGH